MIEVPLKIQVDEKLLEWSIEEREAYGDPHQILVNGELIGTYYSKHRELALEAIPTWLPTLENQLKEVVEKLLNVKVQSVTMFGRDHT